MIWSHGACRSRVFSPLSPQVLRDRDGFTGSMTISPKFLLRPSFPQVLRDEVRSIRLPPMEVTRTNGLKLRGGDGRLPVRRVDSRTKFLTLQPKVVTTIRHDGHASVSLAIPVSRGKTTGVPFATTRVVTSSAPSIGIITAEIKGGSARCLVSSFLVARPDNSERDNIDAIFPTGRHDDRTRRAACAVARRTLA